jgi:hypothetical protein
MSVFKRTVAAVFAVLCLAVMAVSFSGAASATAATLSAASTPSAYPPGLTPELSTTTTDVSPGGNVPLVGSDFTANGTADLSFHSIAVDLGTVSTDGAGGFTATIKVPDDAVLGEHHIEAEDGTTGDIASVEITVVAAGTGAATSTATPGSTGVAVVGLATVGLVLLVGGGLMLMAGRRRKVLA